MATNNSPSAANANSTAANANSTAATSTTTAAATSNAAASNSSSAGVAGTAWKQTPSPAAVTAENPVDSGGDGNAASKKPAAWNKKPIATTAPSLVKGGAAERGGAAVFMATDSWPALSESTKASPKLSSIADASQNLPEFGSALSHQVAGTEALSATVSLSVRSTSSTSQKPTSSNTNHHSNSNHGRPARQRSMKRDGNGGNTQANGVVSHQSSQPTGEGSHHNHNLNSAKPTPGGASESSGKDNMQNHSHREPAAQRNGSGEQPRPRNSFRRGNGGPHPRGDGSHQNYGGRRNDQDRGNHDWNHQRSFNGRDASVQPQAISRSFVRPPPVSTPFVHPLRPYTLMPDMPPIMYLPPSIQLVAPVPAMYYPAPDPELYSEILKQINYYFSNDNLVKDTYLRQNMDENGWVHVGLIANFRKVRNLTTDLYRILDAVKSSTVVEVQADKIRRREDWKQWLMPLTVQFPVVSGSQSPKIPAVSTLSAQIQSVALDGETSDLNSNNGQGDAEASTNSEETTGDSTSTSQAPEDENSSGC